MIVLKATETQRKALEGFYLEQCELKFVKDFNNNWVVGLEVLKDPNFAPIHDKLNELKKIEYLENEQTY
jgi:hypothetical protein